MRASEHDETRPNTFGRVRGCLVVRLARLINRVQKQDTVVARQLNGHVIQSDDACITAASFPDGTDLARASEYILALVIAPCDAGEANAVHRTLALVVVGHVWSPFVVGPNHSDPCPVKFSRKAASGTGRLGGRRPALRAESEGLSLAASGATDRVHVEGRTGQRLTTNWWRPNSSQTTNRHDLTMLHSNQGGAL